MLQQHTRAATAAGDPVAPAHPPLALWFLINKTEYSKNSQSLLPPGNLLWILQAQSHSVGQGFISSKDQKVQPWVRMEKGSPFSSPKNRGTPDGKKKICPLRMIAQVTREFSLPHPPPTQLAGLLISMHTLTQTPCEHSTHFSLPSKFHFLPGSPFLFSSTKPPFWLDFWAHTSSISL